MNDEGNKNENGHVFRGLIIGASRPLCRLHVDTGSLLLLHSAHFLQPSAASYL